MEPYKWYPQRAGRVDLIVERARATGQISDPLVRQEIAKLLVLSKTGEWTARRARAAQAQGRPPGPEGSLGKLVSSHVARPASHVDTLITGADAMLAGEDGPMDGLIAEILVSVPAGSIAGARMKSSATSFRSGCWECPRNRGPTTTDRSSTSPRKI